ncbi:hypothetical protein SISSUDRAFT_1038014 [Sistotremastrum suecicum HHB10207 ss-3]|uniref:Uncharacterized protein n=1 Tax=Sistotremastrum suecicum HHB10207 ss-3 TaxID=1314776 RepID=A0A165XBR7_9AGAM|nr:hypothetical protein SISSUDRAFT_1038014 [Sistotremastrum suecicum HHB10207 ss-3]
MAQINNAGDKHRSPDASNNNLQERNEDPATHRKQKKTDAWNQHEKSVRQSEKRRATAHRKGCTGCHLIVISPVKSKRRRRRRTSSPSSLSNILSTTHDKSPAPLSPKTRADLTDEDESGNSQAEHKTPRNSEEEEEADPEADEVEEGDAHGNTRARNTIRKATMKTKAFDYHQVIAEARNDSLQEVFELQEQNILTLQETDQRSKQYIAQVQQKSYKAARKAAGFHDEEPLNPKTSVSANARYWSYIESIGGKAKARVDEAVVGQKRKRQASGGKDELDGEVETKKSKKKGGQQKENAAIDAAEPPPRSMRTRGAQLNQRGRDAMEALSKGRRR